MDSQCLYVRKIPPLKICPVPWRWSQVKFLNAHQGVHQETFCIWAVLRCPRGKKMGNICHIYIHTYTLYIFKICIYLTILYINIVYICIYFVHACWYNSIHIHIYIYIYTGDIIVHVLYIYNHHQSSIQPRYPSRKRPCSMGKSSKKTVFHKIFCHKMGDIDPLFHKNDTDFLK